MGKKPVHVVMRYSDSMCEVDTIQEHKKVLERVGSVWVAKVGKGMSLENVRVLDEQCKGTPTHLYLMQRAQSRVYRIHRARVRAVAKKMPTREENQTPAYYRQQGIIDRAVLWFKIDELKECRSETIGELTVASSGLPVAEILAYSASPLFRVHSSRT